MILQVKVQPKSSQRKLEKIGDRSYKAHIQSAPTDGKANDELINLIAKEFKIKKYKVEIIGGLSNRNKVVKFDT